MYTGRMYEKRCGECGIIFEGHPQAKYCEDCRPIVRSRQRTSSEKKRKREKGNEARARKAYTKMVQRSQADIAEVAKAAKAMGMSYGKYVAAGCPNP